MIQLTNILALKTNIAVSFGETRENYRCFSPNVQKHSLGLLGRIFNIGCALTQWFKMTKTSKKLNRLRIDDKRSNIKRSHDDEA